MDMTNECRQASSDLLFADLNHGHCYYFSKYTWARRWRVSTQRKNKRANPAPSPKPTYTHRVEPKRRLGFFVRKSHIA